MRALEQASAVPAEPAFVPGDARTARDERRTMFRSGFIPLGVAIAPSMPEPFGDLVIVRSADSEPHDHLVMSARAASARTFRRGLGGVQALYANAGACPAQDAVIVLSASPAPSPAFWRAGDDDRARALLDALRLRPLEPLPEIGEAGITQIWIRRLYSSAREGGPRPPRSDSSVCG